MEYSPPVLSLFGSRPRAKHAPVASSELLLRSFVGEPPERLKPNEHAHRMTVALVWGADCLLDVQEVADGDTLTIGADSHARMQVFHEVTRLGQLPLLEPQADGRTRLFIPAGATARLRLNGEELSIVQLVERGLAQPTHSPVEGAVCMLGLHDRAVLHFNDVRLIARYLRPAATRQESPYGLAFWSRITIYLMIAFTLYRMAAITDFEEAYRSVCMQSVDDVDW